MDRKGGAVQVAVVSDEKAVVPEQDLRVNVYAQNAVRQCHTNRESRAWKFSAPSADPA